MCECYKFADPIVTGPIIVRIKRLNNIVTLDLEGGSRPRQAPRVLTIVVTCSPREVVRCQSEAVGLLAIHERDQ